MIGRHASASDVLFAFLPDSVWELLVAGTNNYIALSCADQYKKNHSRYRLTDTEELKVMFRMRLDMIFKGTRSLADAYDKVPQCSFPMRKDRPPGIFRMDIYCLFI